MKERRRHARKPVSARVKLYHPSLDPLEGKTRDISDGGVFVQLPQANRFEVGEELKMALLEAARTDVIFNVQVVRVQSQGIALAIRSYEESGHQHNLEQLRRQWQRSAEKK